VQTAWLILDRRARPTGTDRTNVLSAQNRTDKTVRLWSLI
jgi:hypothetical protein